jgi:hypothetical protein
MPLLRKPLELENDFRSYIDRYVTLTFDLRVLC